MTGWTLYLTALCVGFIIGFIVGAVTNTSPIGYGLIVAGLGTAAVQPYAFH